MDPILRVVDGAGQQRFRETLNGGKRRFEFVRNVSHEIAAHALELAQIADVMKDKHSAGFFSSAHGRGGCGKKSLAHRAGYNFRVYRRLAAQHTADGFNQFRLPNRFDESATDLWRHVQAKNLSETRVRENHAVGGIHHCDAFDHAAKNCRREVAFIPERADGEVETRRCLAQRYRQFVERVPPGGIGKKGPKIALGDAARKLLQPLHSAREGPRDEQRNRPRDQEHKQRS